MSCFPVDIGHPEKTGELCVIAPDEKESETKQIPNKGKLLVDASCLPGDIRYPTDLGLLNEAREKTEAIIDILYAKALLPAGHKKPRTYRERARKDFLQTIKPKRIGKKRIRKAIRKQLGYLRRNLAIIDTLLENIRWIARPAAQKPLFEPDIASSSSGLRFLPRHLLKSLLVVSEVYRQQEWMYSNRKNRIDDRIVSISQPHIRPIKRGKSRVETEFGAKIDISVVNGITFVDTISWNNFNEGGYLIARIESFRKRFGHYPASVHADKIYRNRNNLQFCKKHGIRLSGPRLGRPKKETTDNAAELKAEKAILRQDAADRNPVEGKFGQGKRRYSLGLVMTKLASTSESSIMIAFTVMNLKRWLAILLFYLKKSAIGIVVFSVFVLISAFWRVLPMLPFQRLIGSR
ncbi:transposase [Desulfosarcina sp. OttesenSCG-928-B08]|nr:transposase [Desulfosarcina sp. OttesenSCG-928-B08]